MKESARFEVEKLDSARWDRIEDAVFERLENEAEPARPFVPATRRMSRWGLLSAFGAGGAVVLAGALLVLPLRRPEPPRFPSHIMTGDDSSRVALGDSSLEIGRRSELVVSGDDVHGVVVVLDRGEVTCEVAARRQRPPFVVQTGAVRFVLADGEARIRRTDDGTTDVFVERGTVAVREGSADFELHRGESWNNVPRPEAALPAFAPNPPERPRAPIAIHPAAPRAVSSTPVAVAPPPPPLASPPAEPSLRERYETAARLEGSDPDAAIARYEDIARGDGAWAATALYAEGRLAYERGDLARAERALDAYAARFPNGSNARDARDLRADIAKVRHR